MTREDAAILVRLLSPTARQSIVHIIKNCTPDEQEQALEEISQAVDEALSRILQAKVDRYG